MLSLSRCLSSSFPSPFPSYTLRKRADLRCCVVRQSACRCREIATAGKLLRRRAIVLLWPPCVADADIFSSRSFFLVSVFFFFSSPNLSGRSIGCLPYLHTWCGLSANLGCRSETCCTRLAGNAGRKKSPKVRHLGTITQLCRAIYLSN